MAGFIRLFIDNLFNDMSKPKPNQAATQLKIADNLAGAEYTNLMNLAHRSDEFYLTFFNVFGASGRVVAKLITSPSHFKRMVGVMQEAVKRYEDQFGVIKEAPTEEKEIGFKPV
ncbi:DUF3467 domain-containing protein [Candidatus Parcubacteria bacterium]|nr:MAG: DUF3467 domain-containing protein [Candidatus Parcubacteria bacterium]